MRGRTCACLQQHRAGVRRGPTGWGHRGSYSCCLPCCSSAPSCCPRCRPPLKVSGGKRGEGDGFWGFGVVGLSLQVKLCACCLSFPSDAMTALPQSSRL